MTPQQDAKVVWQWCGLPRWLPPGLVPPQPPGQEALHQALHLLLWKLQAACTGAEGRARLGPPGPAAGSTGRVSEVLGVEPVALGLSSAQVSPHVPCSCPQPPALCG